MKSRTKQELLQEIERLNEQLNETVLVLSRREKELDALVKGSKSVLEEKSFTDSARAIFDHCKDLIGATSGYVALLNETGDENEVLFLEAGGLPCDVNPELPMPIRGLRAEAYKKNKVVYHNDFMNSEWVDLMLKGHVVLENVMFAPLVIEEKTVGIIGLANKANDFDENDAKIAAGFGELATIALQNSWHLDERIRAENEHTQLIVKLKETEEILKKKEERLELVIKGSNYAPWDWDLKAHELYYSPQWWHQIGYEIDELPTDEDLWKRLIHPEDQKRVIDFFQDALQNNKTGYEIESRFAHKDGHYVPILSRGFISRDENGNPIRVTGTNMDLSQYKKVENALKLNESRFKKAQSMGLVGNWEYDILTKKFWGSDEAKRIYGFNPESEDFTLNEVENCIPDRKRVHQALVDLIEKGRPYNIEFEIRPITGPEKRIIKSIAEVVKDESGMPTKVAGVIQDITIIKLTNENLRKSEEKYRLLFENIMNGFALHQIVLNDLGEPVDFIFIEVNSAFEQLTDLKEKDIIGKKVTEILPGIDKDPADWIDKYGKVVLTGKEIRFENYCEPLEKWFSVLAFSTQKGQFATIFEDITERKETEAAFRVGEKKYRQLFNSLRDNILVADVDRNIVDCNKALSNGFGYTLDEIVGKNTAYLYNDEQEYIAMGEKLQKNMDDTEFKYTIDYKKKSGDVFPGETKVFYLKDDNGDTIGFIGMIRDVTKQKQTEASLEYAHEELKEKTQKLEDMNSALTVLLEKRENDAKELEDKILSNYEKIIFPFLKKLKVTLNNGRQNQLAAILEKNLEEIISPFSRKLSDPLARLTPTEIQIASMIKNDMVSKDIADVLNCSTRTIDTHRDNIRKKLNLRNKKINLKSYLLKHV